MSRPVGFGGRSARTVGSAAPIFWYFSLFLLEISFFNFFNFLIFTFFVKNKENNIFWKIPKVARVVIPNPRGPLGKKRRALP